jgi:hypothetical protein
MTVMSTWLTKIERNTFFLILYYFHRAFSLTIQLTNKRTNRNYFIVLLVSLHSPTRVSVRRPSSGGNKLLHFTSHVKRGPKSTLFLVISYKNTFDFVKFVKLIILSYKLKSRFKISALVTWCTELWCCVCC